MVQRGLFPLQCGDMCAVVLSPCPTRDTGERWGTTKDVNIDKKSAFRRVRAGGERPPIQPPQKRGENRSEDFGEDAGGNTEYESVIG